MAGTVLVVSPHLDDAVLSIGGSISQWTASGRRVVIASLYTTGPAIEEIALTMRGKGTEAVEAVSFNPYVKVYQITDKGLLLQANWGGTKIVKDPELNE